MNCGSLPTHIQTWQMTAPEKFEFKRLLMPKLQDREALVKVAACGVCHTDLGFCYEGTPTIQSPPLTLGHEISGMVVDCGPEDENWLLGKNVIIPAVLPCGECEICRMGRENRCLNQRMPGNNLGIYGGFSDYIPVPAQDLCVIHDLKGLPLSHYAVIADAVTTPYQAAMRANILTGDLVVVIGCGGGVGTYMTQIAKVLGAAVVIGIDINDLKLERMRDFGADYTINASGKNPKDVKGLFKETCQTAQVPSHYGWKIFEASGTKAGQEIALALLGHIGTLVVIGYTTEKVDYMLSKLMAFDAEIHGTWGCEPHYYPDVLELVQSGKIQIEPFLETKPMSQIAEVFEQQHTTGFDRRQVLEPDF